MILTFIAAAFTLAACGGDDGPPFPTSGGNGGGGGSGGSGVNNPPATPFPPANSDGDATPLNPVANEPVEPAPTEPSPGEPNDNPDEDEDASDEPVSIAGAPPPAAREDATYDFKPKAGSRNGAPLEFSISNKPDWATFDPVTGRLTGKPASEHIGTYDDIVISVTDGEHSASMESFAIDVVATASGSVVLSWEAPTERIDGSALVDLAGYRVYWGMVEGEFPDFVSVDSAGMTSFVLEELTPALYYVVATAVDSDGLESEFSNVVQVQID